MASGLVLVNGVPGCGKSTLATPLARELNALLVAKDAIKEALVGAVDGPAALPGLGAVAMQRAWVLAAAAPGLAVVDSWWFRPRDLQHARHGLAMVDAPAVVEVWCHAAIALARHRYISRIWHAVHDDGRRLAEDWERWAQIGKPLGLAPVVAVDTTGEVDVAAVAAAVRAELAGQRTPVRSPT